MIVNDYTKELKIIQQKDWLFHYIAERLFQYSGASFVNEETPIYTFFGIRYLNGIGSDIINILKSGFAVFNEQYCDISFHTKAKFNSVNMYEALSYTDIIMWYYILYKNNKSDYIKYVVDNY